MVLCQITFSVEHVGHNALRSEDLHQVFLAQMVFLHQVPYDIKWTRTLKRIVLRLEVLDQNGQEFDQLLLRWRDDLLGSQFFESRHEPVVLCPRRE